MDRENSIFNAFYGFFSVVHIIRLLRNQLIPIYLCEDSHISLQLQTSGTKHRIFVPVFPISDLLDTKPGLFVPGALLIRTIGSETVPFCSRMASIMHFGSRNAHFCSRNSCRRPSRSQPSTFISVSSGMSPQTFRIVSFRNSSDCSGVSEDFNVRGT